MSTLRQREQRNLEIRRLVAEGVSGREIERRLDVSRHVVERASRGVRKPEQEPQPFVSLTPAPYRRGYRWWL